VRKKPLTGALATPIAPRPIGYLASEEQRAKWSEDWAAEDLGKLDALREHYGIEPGPHQYMALSLAMAREFVPGFQEEAKKGRPAKWDSVTKGILVVEVRRLVVPRTAQGPTWACKQLASQKHWADFLEGKDAAVILSTEPAEALRQIYQSFRNDRFANVAWDAYRWHRQTDTLEEWETFVVTTLAEARQAR
jgi:hypothetical protein